MLFWAVDLFAANPGTGTDQANDCEERESKQLRGRGRINCALKHDVIWNLLCVSQFQSICARKETTSCCSRS